GRGAAHVGGVRGSRGPAVRGHAVRRRDLRGHARRAGGTPELAGRGRRGQAGCGPRTGQDRLELLAHRDRGGHVLVVVHERRRGGRGGGGGRRDGGALAARRRALGGRSGPGGLGVSPNLAGGLRAGGCGPGGVAAVERGLLADVRLVAELI